MSYSLLKFFFAAGIFLGSCSAVASLALPRNVFIKDQNFVSAHTGKPVLLNGPNVVVKGPPYLPYVEGDTFCIDSDGSCENYNNCTSCQTFNQADVDHIKSMGWNTIRLGVVWAGAQPVDEDALDSVFVEQLHAILNLTDANDINVVLDNHGDMVGSAGCGNGVPMWFSRKAAPELIGKPLTTDLPYSIVPSLNVKNVDGYDLCGDNESKWAAYAGDPNYNLLNECCLAMNSPNPGGLGYTTVNQAAMDYLVLEGAGRDAFVRFWRLMAEAVVAHPSAVAAELMNEPMTIRRASMFDTWRACTEAINAVIPDMSVSLADVGEGAVLPAFIGEHNAGVFISDETEQWIKDSSTVFYARHWYGNPSDPETAVKNAQAIGASWNCPTYLTEFNRCEVLKSVADAGISYLYWHYSSYCNTGPWFGDLSVPDETFGGCMLGWGGGDSSFSCEM